MTRVLCSGSFICDFIAADLPGMGGPGDLIYPPGGISLHPGGHSANVAIDLAQLGRRDTAVVGGIGDDVLGDYIESELTRRGLRPHRKGGGPPILRRVIREHAAHTGPSPGGPE